MLVTKNLLVLDKYVQGITNDEIIPAINLSILSNSGNWMCSHGKKQILPLPAPNSLDTLFDISTLTMPVITATLILKLEENKEISLNDKVKKYLPSFKNDKLTILECLTHTGGVDNDIDSSVDLVKEKVLNAVLNINVNSKLKGKYNFSWVNYFLLGLIIETLKEDIDAYAKDVMYDPLMMKRTFFDPELALKSNCACSNVVDGIAICGETIDIYSMIFNGKAGHAGCFLTLQDISHFVTTLINKGTFKQNKFFDEKQLDLIFNEFNETNHSLSWVVGKKENPFKELVSDNALYFESTTGCAMLIEPKKGYGIVFLSNPYHLNKDATKFKEVLKETIRLAIASIQ